MATTTREKNEARQHTAELILVLQEQIAAIRERHPTPGYDLEQLLLSCSHALIHAQDNLGCVDTRMRHFEDSISEMLRLHILLSEVS